MPRKKPPSETLIQDLISHSLADEVLHRIPVEDHTQRKIQEVRVAAQEYLVRQGAHFLDIEDAVRSLLPGLIAELGVEISAAPLYPSYPDLS